MSIDRPAVAALLVAEVTARLPGRLRRRLDERRDLVEDGRGAVGARRWSSWRRRSRSVCGQRLARCACWTRSPATACWPHAASTSRPCSWPSLLAIGAASAGLVVQGELLRAAHACWLAGLHRTAGALTRTVHRLAELHGERPEYRLDFLLGDVADALTSALAIARSGDVVSRSAVGVARRAYSPAGSLRLTGVFTEAVLSAAGMAGVVTYLVDQEGRLRSAGDVAPGGVERVAAVYGSPVEIGDLALSHRELGRSSV